MKIQFFLDEESYSGECQSKEAGDSCVYLVDLGKQLQFSMVMGEDAQWISDDNVNPKIVSCVGNEIERREDGIEDKKVQTLYYQSEQL